MLTDVMICMLCVGSRNISGNFLLKISVMQLHKNNVMNTLHFEEFRAYL